MKSYSLATLTFVSSALALTVKRVVPPGAQVIQPGYSIYKCLTASNVNKAAPTIQDCVPNAENQLWVIDENTNTIQNTHKKCLDVPSGNQKNKQKLQIYQCTSGNLNQVFAFNGSLIQLQGTSKCMDLTDGKRSNGIVPQLYTCDDTNPNQVWTTADQMNYPIPQNGAAPPDGNPHPIVPIASTQTCLTALSANNAAKVVAEPCDGSDSQAFSFIGGQFRIYDNFCLDVTDGKRVKGTKMQIYTCGPTNNKNQIWQVIQPYGFPQGHQIQLKAAPTLCLDLTSGSTKNGNPAQIYTCSNSKLTNSNQYFYLNEDEYEEDD